MRKPLVIAAAALFACVHEQRAASPNGDAPPTLRLPAQARPVRQSVDLKLAPDAGVFTGVTDLELEIESPTKVLWLNQNALQIARAHLKAGGKEQEAKVIEVPKDFVGFAFGEPLAPGPATLHIEYSGIATAKESRGIYRQREGQDWYLLTQFEAIDARRAFPCFDEPGYKTPWQITLRVPKGMPAFSNTAATAERDEGDRHVYQFAETKPLPSYLVAFAAGPFEAVQAGTAGAQKSPVRILALKGMAARTRYAAEASPKLLTLLEEWFGVPYGYPKMDSIVTPMAGGAMENPGLVTFGYQLLQARPEEETVRYKRASAGVTTHEFAHQWFGDLVTTAWWDDIWLNEAFATWMSPIVLGRFQPDWNAAEMRGEARAQALRVDSQVSARKVRQPIESTDDIANAFDSITYEKGASVIRMFEQWVGQARFQKGVQRYLREHANGNATAAEFLQAIAAEAGDKGPRLAQAFSTFLDQAGAPLITAKLACEPGKPARLQLSQERYLPVGAAKLAPQKWEVPVCLRWAKEGGADRACTLLTSQTAEVPLGAGCPAWFTANHGVDGYYRVDPGAAMLDKLVAGGVLSGEELAGAVDDGRALVAAGRLPIAAALGWLKALAGSSDRGVVQNALALGWALAPGELVAEELRPQVAEAIGAAFSGRARAAGWEAKAGESDDAQLLRPQLLELAGDRGEDAELRSAARAQAEKWLADPRSVGPEVARVALRLSAIGGDRAWFDKLLAAAKATKERADRTRLLRALGDFRAPELQAAALQLALSPDFDPREAFGATWSMTGNPQGARAALDFVKAHFDDLVARLPDSSAAGFPFLATSLCTADARNEVEQFFTERVKKAEGGPRNLQHALEAMELCAAFREAQGKSAEAFLRGGAQAAR